MTVSHAHGQVELSRSGAQQVYHMQVYLLRVPAVEAIEQQRMLQLNRVYQKLLSYRSIGAFSLLKEKCGNLPKVHGKVVIL